MSWLYLFMAILCEVTGTMTMKWSAGFTRLWPSLGVFVFYGMALTLMTLALRRIDLSTAYTIWAGVGTMLVALIGMICFDEAVTPLKVISIALVVVGVIGLCRA